MPKKRKIRRKKQVVPSSATTKGGPSRMPTAPSPADHSLLGSDPLAATRSYLGGHSLPGAQRDALLTQLGRVQGNRSLTRMAISLQRDDQDRAAQIAEQVYNALYGWNDEEQAIKALQGHNAQLRRRIQEQFRLKYGRTLAGYLKEQLSGDWLVKAFALLHSSHYHGYHTEMALALIPLGTRDREIFRILQSLPLAGRKEMERRYNRTFAEIGQGSLKKDLEDDLSGWRKEKSLALLHRDLTSADKLYFDSVAIMGTNTDAVVKRIQDEWNKGPASFARLERDWDRYVRNQAGWTGERWTDMSLQQAMADELSGEAWEMVKAVLDGYEAYKRQGKAEGKAADEATLFAREQINLKVALDTLTAATTGGYTGIGTNEAQLFAALSTIRKIWKRRIARARRARNRELQERYEQQWREQRRSLMGIVESEISRGSADYRRARLTLMGELTPADEVYLAGEARDYDKVVSLLTEYWAKGQMNTLLAQARTPRRDTDGTVVRPTFDPSFVVPPTQGVNARRAITITRPDLDDAGRGALRLKLELEEGTSDGDLKRAYKLLTTTGIKPALRTAVVRTFVAANLSHVKGDTPIARFLAYITKRYEKSTTCYDFRDLLDPSADPAELLRRAEGRQKAASSGFLDPVLRVLIRSYDIATGEDTEAVVLESLERLRYMARRAGANPQELAAMMAMSGARTPQALARLEYGAFRERLEDLRRLKRAIADAIATTAELAVEAALTVLTGGTAAGALLASMSAAVAGMLLREAALGQDYDLISRQNVQQLVLAIAGHGFGALGKNAFNKVMRIGPDKLAELSKRTAFIQEAVTEGVKQIGVGTLAAGMENRLPSAENIANGALSLIGGSMGAGTRQLLSASVKANMSAIARLRQEITGSIVNNAVAAVVKEGTTLAVQGAGRLSGAEVAEKFGRSAAQAIGQGLLESLKPDAQSAIHLDRETAEKLRKRRQATP